MALHNPLTIDEAFLLSKSQKFPSRRILSTPPDKDGAFGYYDLESYLGSGYSGAGTKYLADDMTWKTPSGSGGFSYTLINLTFASSPYTVLPTTGYTLYNVNCTGGNIIINFPTAVGNAAVYGIKKTDSSANTITLTPNGVETIDGEASKVILFQNTQVEVYSNNANLFLK